MTDLQAKRKTMCIVFRWENDGSRPHPVENCQCGRCCQWRIWHAAQRKKKWTGSEAFVAFLAMVCNFWTAIYAAMNQNSFGQAVGAVGGILSLVVIRQWAANK